MTDATTYAGIDVAKDRLDVVLRPSGEYLEATNDEPGIRSVLRRLRREKPGAGRARSDRGMERPAGVPVAIVNPRQVRREGHRQARQDRPDRRGGARPLRRGGEAGAAPPGRRARPGSLRSAAQEAPDPRRNDRRGQQGALTAPKALRKRIKAHLRWLKKELERTVKESLVLERAGRVANERPRGGIHALGDPAGGGEPIPSWHERGPRKKSMLRRFRDRLPGRRRALPAGRRSPASPARPCCP